MGKSPGKWIKTVLFGKKTSKSNLSKGREISKSASGKAALVSSKEPAYDLAVDPPSIPQQVPCTGTGIEENSALRQEAAPTLPNDGVIISSARQDGDEQKTTNLGSPKDSERIMLEEAAIKAQAAFRGYLARRAFRALKGIIRLQAFIRGHLVRRQAVATLYCIHRIVKLQALVRGQKVRRSDNGSKLNLDPKLLNSCETNTSIRVEKLSINDFVCKLLALSPTTMPLHFQYGPGEPNSAWDWLNRWTMSRAWETPSKPIIDSKFQTKHGSIQTVETDQARPKRSVQRLPTSKLENGSSKATSESEKPKRNMRKVSNHPVSSVQEHPQNEIEKVKRNLKKTSNPSKESSVRPEIDTEKPSRIKKASTAAPDGPEQGIGDPSEKVEKDTAVAVPKPSDEETSPKSPAADGPVDELNEHPPVNLQPKQKNGTNENTPLADKELSSKDGQTSNEYQRTSRRRASLPAKQDSQDNGLHNTPRVPSYMATTESAKAKFRAQGSPRFSQDGTEENGLTRRHSLPSSTNGKLSLSPRVQRLVQASSKGGIRSEKSLLSSRDANEKVIQAEWKR
ncbi:protein IQ-DOMAIN 29 [Cornus florida]|uniref:protein IQ-DOMAIN 29 n=1 Tax=Cornus florida TaxID=4283 RepID=UPI002897B190|nr:protein IQ-DOMAIN 29 [Cornus florida]XP_059648877.1 protein IQ-DOMAIN 29 [Cornus florida]